MNEENKIEEVGEKPIEQIKQEDLTVLRDEKCEPLAEEIIQIIAKHKPSAAAKNQEELYKIYSPIVIEINTMLREKDATISDVNYTWTIVQSIIDSAKGLSVNTIEQAFETAQKKLFSVDNISDLSLQEINNVLK